MQGKCDSFNRYRKNIRQNLTTMHDKNSKKPEIDGNCLNLMKNSYN